MKALCSSRGLLLVALCAALPARADKPRRAERSEAWSENRRFLVEVLPGEVRSMERRQTLEPQLGAKERECDLSRSRRADSKKNDAAGRAKLQKCQQALSQLRASAAERRETQVNVTEVKGKKRALRWSVEVTASDPRAIVSNAGHVVLSGWGNEENLTVFTTRGRRIAQLGPQDFLTAEELDRVPRSSSHLNWGGAAGFDLERGQLIVFLSLGGSRRPTEAPGPSAERRVSLTTGEVIRE